MKDDNCMEKNMEIDLVQVHDLNQQLVVISLMCFGTCIWEVRPVEIGEGMTLAKHRELDTQCQ